MQRVHKLLWQRKGTQRREEPCPATTSADKAVDRGQSFGEFRRMFRSELQERCLSQGIDLSHPSEENRNRIRSILDQILKDHLKVLPGKEQLAFKSSTGREFIGISLRVVDAAGQEVARDNKHVGEIVVKGDSVTPGYWNLPEETKKAFRDGWLQTGDLAVINEEEYVTIVDRKKDMIITGGENVYSTEVENALYLHPAVLEAAVIGVPDPKWGEAIKACVVLKPGKEASEKDIIAFCKENLGHYKAPKSVDFLEALPITGSGKIYKKGLRDAHWAHEKKVN
jgi:acyl-CoA synthetase (AMP-forming)/AMP-acid ligase II